MNGNKCGALENHPIRVHTQHALPIGIGLGDLVAKMGFGKRWLAGVLEVVKI
uniref:Uncharacterized protein n=1 Tax=Fagus sylvatica TaxID=28930 RepID=A0A2N9FNX0_FAGSY